MRFSIRGSGTEQAPGQRDGATVTDGATSGTSGAAVGQVSPNELEVEVLAEGGEVVSSGSPWVLVARTFAQNKLAIVGLVIVAITILFSFIGPLLYHTDQLN